MPLTSVEGSRDNLFEIHHCRKKEGRAYPGCFICSPHWVVVLCEGVASQARWWHGYQCYSRAASQDFRLVTWKQVITLGQLTLFHGTSLQMFHLSSGLCFPCWMLLFSWKDNREIMPQYNSGVSLFQQVISFLGQNCFGQQKKYYLSI